MVLLLTDILSRDESNSSRWSIRNFHINYMYFYEHLYSKVTKQVLENVIRLVPLIDKRTTPHYCFLVLIL